jgi:hypothetical protein
MEHKRWNCVLTCTLIQTIYREKTKTWISFVSKYKWGHRSTSCLLSIYRLYQSTSEDTDPRLSLLSIYCLYQSTSEDTVPPLVFHLYIVYREKTRRGSVSSLVVWYKRYMERRQDVDLCPHLYFDTNDIYREKTKRWICVLTCTLIQTIYREKTRHGSVSSLVL